MLRLVMILLVVLGWNISSAMASMPVYYDDEEFKQCTKLINDWDTCAEEESHRVLNLVKREYRTILSNPQILQWHSSVEESSQTLQDMYESWTAFRNRLCSLSNKAAQYLEGFVTERIACNLYYTQHHEDHLNDIILLMTGQAPQNKQEFFLLFLEDDEHDEEYRVCSQTQPHSDCIAAEVVRSTAAIKKVYSDAVNDKYVGKWNNGNGLKSGNYRDMFDSWIAYRNRICSLAVWAYQSFYGNDSIEMNDCIQYFNYEKLEAFTNVMVAARSTLDVDLDEVEDDGGEAEGKTIKPLERRIDGGSTNEENLEMNDNETVKVQDSKESAAEAAENTVENGKVIPDWARQ